MEVGNGAYDHPSYNPRLGELEGSSRGGIPHLKPHEQEYFRLQNFYQTEVPLFPSGIGGSGSYRSMEDAIMQSAHSKDDGPFTQALKNLSNNLAIQYAQPGVNEKVPKFDGDYTKWNGILAGLYSPGRSQSKAPSCHEVKST